MPQRPPSPPPSIETIRRSGWSDTLLLVLLAVIAAAVLLKLIRSGAKPDQEQPPHRHRFEADRVTCYWVTRIGGLSCLRDAAP